MNRGELTEIVARSMGNCSKAAADRAIGAVRGGIPRALRKQHTVTLGGLGTSTAKTRRARVGRDPRNGAVIRIPPGKTVGFRAGLDLKSKI